ncbi:DUF1853 family protein [Winogradskyella sp.]|uniref:DUF1853 family protein n=1 Tax=Winogradskyella sp. TaxID=1883156 RepID=UPI003BA9CDFB
MENEINHKAMFEGFQNTPLLWKSDTIIGLKQWRIDNTSKVFIPTSQHKALRLGKWIEVYTSFQIREQSHADILEENLQIKQEKQTIGELDLLLLKNKQPIHLEIAYKFYLYDTTKTYTNDLERWIGPNRKDSFIYKIHKLKEKQLPLLYHYESAKMLENKGLKPEDFDQFVCFKAQLFLPYQQRSIDIAPLNKECIKGWCLSFNALHQLSTFKFHLVNKLDWLCRPKLDVDWLDYEQAQSAIASYMDRKQSPLCWIKDQHKDLQKCFITWW